MNKKSQPSPGTLRQNGVHLQEHEFATIKALLEKGLDVELIPPSQIKGVFLPDVLINGIPWEIKAPEGNSKKTIKHNIQNALHQSPNIILDLRRCKLDASIAINSARREFFMSKRARRMIIITPEKTNTGAHSKQGTDNLIFLDYKK